jgi:hypothetical protein
MTTQTLNAKYGWPNPYAVEFWAQLDATSSVNPLPPGSVVHLTPSGTFLPGVGNAAVFPLITFLASNDPTVTASGGGNPATDAGAYVGTSSSGNIMALPVNGAYELVSTNVDLVNYTSYPPNTPLTSPTTLASGVYPGTITQGTIGVNTIIGITSRGLVDNGYSYGGGTATMAIAFWPWWIPG